MQFKPAPENLISKERVVEAGARGDEEESSDETEELETSLGVYVPPRVVAMPYKEEQRKSQSIPKSQLGKSKLIRELRDEVSDFPSELQV